MGATDIAAILRRHLPETITQLEGTSVLVDCSCGTEVRGVMPTDVDITHTGALLYVLADHLGEVVAR